MGRISLWLSWFFYNSSTLWTAIFLASILVPLSAMANNEILVYTGMATVGVSLLIMVILGIINLIQAPHCIGCGQILPLGWDATYCRECNTEVWDTLLQMVLSL